MMLREFSAFFNQQYRDAPDGPYLLKVQNALLRALRQIKSEKPLPEHIFFG